jgi:hypothetical protein
LHLDLSGALFSKGKKEYGHLGPKTILFLGSIKFNWKEKDSLKIKETEFRIFRPFSEAFELLLRRDLMSCPSLSPRASKLPKAKSQSPEESIHSPEVVSADEPSASASILSEVVGCFDSFAKELQDDSEK